MSPWERRDRWARWRELPARDWLDYARAYAPWRRSLWDDAAPDRPAFLDRLTPGLALDVGCGSGRNAVALAERGWSVIGVELFGAALARAQARAARAGARVRWIQAPASRLDALGLPPVDLALDVFGPASDLEGEARVRYARALAGALSPRGVAALFTFEGPAALEPFLAVMAVDHGLAQIAPRSPAGRWWLLRPRATPSP